MNTKKLTQTAILSTVALTIFVIEAQLPPIWIPGVKLGLSNVVTLLAMMFISVPSALCVMIIRITLGAFFCGSVTSFMFSLTGGMLAFAVMALLINRFGRQQVWVVSVFGAIAHSLGQLIAAYILIRNISVTVLLPILIICSVITGAMTGLIAQRLWYSPLRRRLT